MQAYGISEESFPNRVGKCFNISDIHITTDIYHYLDAVIRRMLH